MAKPTTKQPRNGITQTSKTAAKPKPTPEPAISPSGDSIEKLTARLRSGAAKHFGVTMPMRDERASLKVGHALREMIGLDLNAKLQKEGQRLDWNKYNQFFNALFGPPDALKHELETIAGVAAQIFEWLSLNSDEAIPQLIKYNQDSLRRRNEQQKAKADFEFDDFDEDDEDIVDDLSDDEDDEDDEDEAADDDEFEDEFGDDE